MKLHEDHHKETIGKPPLHKEIFVDRLIRGKEKGRYQLTVQHGDTFGGLLAPILLVKTYTTKTGAIRAGRKIK